MAGILDNYNALYHFLCPSLNSMRRIAPSSYVGAYKFWSIENKEAPIRLLYNEKPFSSVTHFEIKSLDHTANHYSGLAAIIASGVEGIKKKSSLP